MNEKNTGPVMEISLSYSLCDREGKEIESAKAQVRLDEEKLSIHAESGSPISFPFREVLKVDPGDYQITLSLTSDEKLTLSKLGYSYEDFLRSLCRVRNELLLKDMLMHESLKKSGVPAEFIYLDEKGDEQQKDRCELRLYETALVIIPEKNEMTRIPFSDVDNIKEEDHRIAITMESGAKLILSKMGRQFQSFKDTFSGLINELSLKVQSSLKELLPAANPSIIRKCEHCGAALLVVCPECKTEQPPLGEKCMKCLKPLK